MAEEGLTRIKTREAEVVATVVVSTAEVEVVVIVVVTVEEVEVETEECMIVADFNSNTIRVITISNKTLEDIKVAWDRTTTFLNSNSSNNTDSQIRTEETTRGIIMIPTTNRIEGEHLHSSSSSKEPTRFQRSHPTDRSP